MPMIPTTAANVGGKYNTKNWIGWPADNPYAPAQPTQRNALQIVLKLKPASGFLTRVPGTGRPRGGAQRSSRPGGARARNSQP